MRQNTAVEAKVVATLQTWAGSDVPSVPSSLACQAFWSPVHEAPLFTARETPSQIYPKISLLETLRAFRLTDSEDWLRQMSWTKNYLTSAKRRVRPNAKEFLSKSKMRGWKEALSFLTFIRVGVRGCTHMCRWRQTSSLSFHHMGPRDPTQAMRNTYKWGRDGGFESRSWQSALMDLSHDVLKCAKQGKARFWRATQRELRWGCVNCHRGTSN